MSASTEASARVTVQSSAFTAGRDVTLSTTVNNTYATETTSVSQWLSKFTPINQYTIQDETFEKVSPGTCAWILENHEFERWISGNCGVFWGVGIPGAGKTILTWVLLHDPEAFFVLIVDHFNRSFVINHLRTQDTDPGTKDAVAFFYCRYNNHLSLTQILVSLLLQLVISSKLVEHHVKDNLYTTCSKQQTEPTRSAVQTALRAAICLVPRTFIAIDALDELHEFAREELVEFLVSLKEPLFITSRKLTLECLSSRSIDIRAPDADLRMFIKQEIYRLTKLRLLLKNRATVVTEIIDTILKKSDGMFLLSALQVAALGGVTNISSLRKSVQDLPVTWAGMYELTLERIMGQSAEESLLALRAILWVTHACRPLRPVELMSVLAVDTQLTKFDPDAVADESILESVCCGLLSVEEEGGVRLIHWTTHDFFQNYSKEPFDDPHTFAATVCSIYQEHYSNDSHGRLPEFQSESHPFLQYTVSSLGHHTLQSTLMHNGQIPNHMQYRLSQQSFRVLLGMPKWRHPEWTEMIHFAAFCGLLEWIKSNPNAINQRSHHYQITPLMYACFGGQAGVVSYLLETGMVDVNAMDKRGWTALSAASRTGNISTVQLLLNFGAFVKAGALLEACWSEQPEVVRLLLNHLALRSQPDNHDLENANILEKYTPIREVLTRRYIEAVGSMLVGPSIKTNAVVKKIIPVILALRALLRAQQFPFENFFLPMHKMWESAQNNCQYFMITGVGTTKAMLSGDEEIMLVVSLTLQAISRTSSLVPVTNSQGTPSDSKFATVRIKWSNEAGHYPPSPQGGPRLLQPGIEDSDANWTKIPFLEIDRNAKDREHGSTSILSAVLRLGWLNPKVRILPQDESSTRLYGQPRTISASNSLQDESGLFHYGLKAFEVKLEFNTSQDDFTV